MDTGTGYDTANGIDPYRALFDQAPICIHEIDAQGRLLSMNRAGLGLVGVASEEQVCGRAYLDFVTPAERERIRHLMDDAFDGQASEFEFSAAGTNPQRYFYSCFIPCPNAGGVITRLIGISADITARKAAAAELQRLNRTHAVLSRCNHDLARSVDEVDLLKAFCRNLVEIGGYLFAWVGYAQHDSAKSVRMMAHAGPMEKDFSLTTITWAGDERRYSACGQCIHTGRPVVFRDIEKEAEFAPWRQAALRQGARSMIALPLKTGGQPFGNFSIFSTEANAFGEQELALLVGLAEDLAFGIETTRARKARKQEVRRLREQVEQDERRRLAATLHDGVAQSVQAVNLGLKRLRALSAGNPQPHAELLNQIIDDIGAIIGELREVSQELRPRFLERMDLRQAIRYHCSELSERTGMAINLASDDEPLQLDSRVKTQCFLSVREALNNALKHAMATRIDVTLETQLPDFLGLRIADDGVGFDPSAAFELPSGLGLSMISERAESVGGHAEILSAPGEGTTVTITVPRAYP